MSIYAVKTTASQERTVADMLITREEPEIHAALAPDSLTSYVMVEADGTAAISRALEDIPHARSWSPNDPRRSVKSSTSSARSPTSKGSPRATSSS